MNRPPGKRDRLGSPRAFALAWGLPIAALIAAVFLVHPPKTLVWAAALVWMGAACIANAARCDRRHCYFTGPFFLMGALVAGLHGFGVVRLGADGWLLLGVAVGVGGGALWCLPESVWGKFAGGAPKQA